MDSMKRNYIDLHAHTIESLDGTYTPEQLVEIAINSGIKYLAIADHDSVSSIDRAIKYASDKDIIVIPAIELSAIINNTPLHILGYNIDYNHPGYKQRRKFVDEKLINWSKLAINSALEYGFKFNPEDVYKIREDGLICEELIGQVILNDSRNDNDERLKEFRPGGKLSDNPTFNFYKEFYTEGKPCFIEYDFNMPLKEASKLIHESGGKMFLAHPKHNIGFNEELLNSIIAKGLDGIEVFSSYHDKEATEFYFNKAKKHNLLMSVGSDFHGRSKPSIKMGSTNYDEDELIKTLNKIVL